MRPRSRTPPGWPSRSASPSRRSTSPRRRARCWPTSTTRSPTGEPVYDVTFENVQAGLRYDYLFRLANHRGGIVVGTGDLSELALGWCTYGVGDQMSHYNVNAGVPKTLVQHLIRWVAETNQFDEETNELLEEILEQEITPELIPTTEGKKPQATEDSVGPYSLQDFSLFRVLRFGDRPVQDRVPGLARLARRVGGGVATGLPGRAAYVVRPRRRSVRGWRSSSSGSSPASSSARRCPTAPRSAPAAPCPPAATGGCRPTPIPPPGWPSSRTCRRPVLEELALASVSKPRKARWDWPGPSPGSPGFETGAERPPQPRWAHP